MGLIASTGDPAAAAPDRSRRASPARIPPNSMPASNGGPVSSNSSASPVSVATASNGTASSRNTPAARSRGRSTGRSNSAAVVATPGRLRPLLPSVDGERAGKRSTSPQSQQPKKKRMTVQAACQNCRKRKVKCDGVRPICAPCISSGVACEYLVPEGLSQRDAERQRMSQVSKSHRNLLAILDLLRRGPDADAAEILRQVKTAETLEDAVARISDAALLSSSGIDASLGAGTASPDGVSPAYGGRFVSHNRRLASPFDNPERVFECLYRNDLPSTLFRNHLDLSATELLPVSRWTPGFDDDYHLTHLVTLFWTWDNTFVHMLDRHLFLEDMRLADPSDPAPDMEHIFCSSFLVVCLLGASCLHSTHTNVYDVQGDRNSRGRRFIRAAEEMLDSERKRPSLTLLQGLALLWLYEGSTGDGAVAERYYCEMSSLYSSLGLHQKKEPPVSSGWNSRLGREFQALSHILWGYYSLHAKFAVNFERQLYLPRPKIGKTFEHQLSYLARPKSVTSHWCAYPVDCRFQPSHHRELLIARSSLAELADDLMRIVGRSESGVPDVDRAALVKLEGVYYEFLKWKSRLPDYLQPNNSVLPSVLTLHATYETMLIRLFVPLAAKYANERFGGSTPSVLKRSSAFALMNHVWSFRAHYTLNNEYWLSALCATAALAVLFDLDGGSIDVFVRACQVLYETGEFIRFANKNLTVIQRLVERYRVRIPDVGQSVRTKYFVALRSRPSTVYIDDFRISMYLPSEDGTRVDDVQIGMLIDRTESLSLGGD